MFVRAVQTGHEFRHSSQSKYPDATFLSTESTWVSQKKIMKAFDLLFVNHWRGKLVEVHIKSMEPSRLTKQVVEFYENRGKAKTGTMNCEVCNFAGRP